MDLLRHSVSTHMLRAGADIEEVRFFLGHSSVATTMVYAKVDPGAVQNTTAAIEEKLISKIEVKEDKKSELDAWLDGLMNPPRS
ncbi:MAG: tyrosine-type recombinase/integrase [Coriobacteriales bacterium]